ncbi:hypothetical protein UT300012_21830 [Paraclostridium bifermentans]
MVGPVRTNFYDEGDFTFKGNEVEMEKHFTDGSVVERFVDVLESNEGCMSFTIDSYDCEKDAEEFREFVRLAEQPMGPISLGVSKTDSYLHIILGSDKFRFKDYRTDVAKYIKESTMFANKKATSSVNVSNNYEIKVEKEFLEYCKFILGFSGVDSLYEITDDKIKALHVAYPTVTKTLEIDNDIKLELTVGISEEECYGYLDNKVLDKNGNYVAINDSVCSDSIKDYTEFTFNINDRQLCVKLIEGGFRNLSRMSLF